MLILSRSHGQSIVLDGGVRIVVLGQDRKGVRLGIEAPAGVRILRGEIVSQIEDENRRAITDSASRDSLPNGLRPIRRDAASTS